MKDGLKCAAVFIGTVIGAGFATGQEVLLYFGNSDISVPVLAGLTLGLFCAYFMRVGASVSFDGDGIFSGKKAELFYDACMYICAYVTFIAMFSGAETLFYKTFGIGYTGIIWVVLAAFISVNGLKFMKILNGVAVPVIMALITVIFIKSAPYEPGGRLNFLNSVTYSAMNIVLSMGIMVRLGRNADKKTIATAGICSGVVMATLLAMITLAVRKSGGEMPMFTVAESHSLKYAAGIVILLAVFTTMVSALETAADIISPVFKRKTAAIVFIFITSVPFIILFSFESLIEYFYPLVSGMGCLAVIALSISVFLKKRSRKASKSVDNNN